MHRDPTNYQTLENGKMLSVSDASREHIEQELMRVYDILHHLEDYLTKPAALIGAMLEGKNALVEETVSPIT